MKLQHITKNIELRSILNGKAKGWEETHRIGQIIYDLTNTNAWKYRNESEALAGLAVEITKEMEGIMTEAQWLSNVLEKHVEKPEANYID